MAVVPGGVIVAATNGVVYQFDRAGQIKKRMEVGDVDDIGMDNASNLHVRYQGFLTVALRETGDTVWDSARVDELEWFEEYECTPGGYAVQGALDYLLAPRSCTAQPSARFPVVAHWPE
jgi:hypothetical protein